MPRWLDDRKVNSRFAPPFLALLRLLLAFGRSIDPPGWMSFLNHRSALIMDNLEMRLALRCLDQSRFVLLVLE